MHTYSGHPYIWSEGVTRPALVFFRLCDTTLDRRPGHTHADALLPQSDLEAFRARSQFSARTWLGELQNRTHAR